MYDFLGLEYLFDGVEYDWFGVENDLLENEFFLLICLLICFLLVVSVNFGLFCRSNKLRIIVIVGLEKWFIFLDIIFDFCFSSCDYNLFFCVLGVERILMFLLVMLFELI